MTKRDPVVAALKKLPQLRAHHAQRLGWDPKVPHAVPQLGDIRHESTVWVWHGPPPREYVVNALHAAQVHQRAKLLVVEHDGRTWVRLTLKGKATDRDALKKALGTAGESVVLDIRAWVPADHKAVAKHLPKAFT